MRLYKTIFVFFVLAILGLMSCEDDKNLSKTDIITNTDWVVTSMTISPGINLGDGEITDLFVLMDECDKDDIYRFFADGSFQLDKNGLLCYENEAQVQQGNWQFNENETVLTVTTIIDGATQISEYEIIELNKNKIKGKMTINYYGMPLTPEIIFSVRRLY